MPKTWYIIRIIYKTNIENQTPETAFGGIKMSNVCEICGKKKIYGARIIRRGLAKKQGGIGMHVVKVSPRTFEPNIQSIRVKEANGTVVRKKVCTACIRGGKATKAC